MAKQKKKAKTKRTSKAGGLTGIGWKAPVIAAAVLVVFAGVIGGFVLLDRYVNQELEVTEKTGPLELRNTPSWAGDDLLNLIAQTAGGYSFTLDENTSLGVAQNLSRLEWLYDVRVQVTPQTVQVFAQYRKPVAKITHRNTDYYLDKDRVLLRPVPLPDMTFVEITGFNAHLVPDLGGTLESQAVENAIKLIQVLGKMDEISCPERPLLREIESVDVANYEGRKTTGASHIILRAKDGTEIFWGAGYGQAGMYLEAGEKEKVAMLYGFYKEYKTLMGLTKYIDLRIPQKEIPKPHVE